MKRISQWLSHSRLAQLLLSTLFVAVIFFANSLPVIAGSSDPTQGTVKLDEIQQKTQEAIDAPAMSLKAIEERSKGGLNEVQGSADYDKMINSDDAELPVVEQAEDAASKAKLKSKRK
jgi:hypothetical protein